MDSLAYRLHQLRVQYAEHIVLEVSALNIATGGVTVVVGPNGAGKTTLLRVLALLLEPSSGDLELNSRRVKWRERSLRHLRLQVTYVAQSPLLFRRSVRSNLEYGLRRRGLDFDSRVEATLAAVGLEGFADRPAWKLSGGETQRVAIARALAIDPPIYLFDEPTANIDRQYVPVIEDLVRELGRRGRTVVMSTHNQEQAQRLGEATVFLEAGRVIAGAAARGFTPGS